eukprot:m.122192 g.122192  ORF g.122192 m.122192 type:complete len:316 (+) comp9391_c1_seq2:133-1080(+)
MVAISAQLQLSVRYGVTRAEKIRSKVFDPEGASTKSRVRLDNTASTNDYDALRVTFIPTSAGTYNVTLLINDRIVKQKYAFTYNDEPPSVLLKMTPVPLSRHSMKNANQVPNQPLSSSSLPPKKGKRQSMSMDPFCSVCSTTKKVTIVGGIGYCKKHLRHELFSDIGMVTMKVKDVESALFSFRQLPSRIPGFISLTQARALMIAIAKDLLQPGIDDTLLLTAVHDILLENLDPNGEISEGSLLRSIAFVLGREKFLRQESNRVKKTGISRSNQISTSALRIQSSSSMHKKQPKEGGQAKSVFSGDRKADGWMLY